MSLKKWAVVLGLIGLGLGAVVCTFITTVISTIQMGDGNLYVIAPGFLERIGNPLAAYMLEQAVAGIFVAVELACAVVYAIESWSILKATLVHFAVCISVFIPTALFLGWISLSNPLGFCLMIAGWVLGYFMVWFMFYVSYRMEIKKMNEDILRLKEMDEK